jgi:hypothetical protein
MARDLVMHLQIHQLDIAKTVHDERSRCVRLKGVILAPAGGVCGGQSRRCKSVLTASNKI